MTTASERLLAPEEIGVRRRPLAVGLVWLWQLASALAIATPLHAWARWTWAGHPDGDAVLFRPGGRSLIAWLGDEGPALSVVTRSSLAAFVVTAAVGQLVTGALLASLATGREGPAAGAPPLRFALRAAARAYLPLASVGVLTFAIDAFLLGLGHFVSSGTDQALLPSLGDARSFTARLVVFALFVLAALAVGVVGDLARAIVARDAAHALLDPPAGGVASSFGAQLRSGVVGALRVTARGPFARLFLAWSWRAAASLALVYAGGVAGDVVAGQAGGALFALFVLHQALVLARAALRASWLACALRALPVIASPPASTGATIEA